MSRAAHERSSPLESLIARGPDAELGAYALKARDKVARGKRERSEARRPWDDSKNRFKALKERHNSGALRSLSHLQCSNDSAPTPGAACIAPLALAPGYLISRLRREDGADSTPLKKGRWCWWALDVLHDVHVAEEGRLTFHAKAVFTQEPDCLTLSRNQQQDLAPIADYLRKASLL